jgi:hypothetical protein
MIVPTNHNRNIGLGYRNEHQPEYCTSYRPIYRHTSGNTSGPFSLAGKRTRMPEDRSDRVGAVFTLTQSKTPPDRSDGASSHLGKLYRIVKVIVWLVCYKKGASVFKRLEGSVRKHPPAPMPLAGFVDVSLAVTVAVCGSLATPCRLTRKLSATFAVAKQLSYYALFSSCVQLLVTITVAAGITCFVIGAVPV